MPNMFPKPLWSPIEIKIVYFTRKIIWAEVFFLLNGILRVVFVNTRCRKLFVTAHLLYINFIFHA